MLLKSKHKYHNNRGKVKKGDTSAILVRGRIWLSLAQQLNQRQIIFLICLNKQDFLKTLFFSFS